MKKPFFNRFPLRGLVLLLTLLLLLPTLVACGEKTDQRATSVVGTVDGNNIYYDELYALATLYAPVAKQAADPRAELDRLIRENIVVNTAILRLCESVGLKYDEDDLRKSVNAEIIKMTTDSFEGDEDAFRSSMAENGLTERYLRYSIGLELLYNDLLIYYPQKGLLPDSNDEVRAYILENFVHVYHLALFYDETNQAEKLAKITEAQQALSSGEKTMYSLIKEGYSEDFLDPSGHGYYVAKGTMNEAYEEAAFALKMNEVSPVIDASGSNNLGKDSSCYYVLQRFPMDETYVDGHLSELRNEYYGSVIYADLTEIRESLTFTPNALYDSLDLSALLPPREGAPTWAWITVVAVVSVALVAMIVLAVVLIRKKPRASKANTLPRKKS